LKSTIDTYFSHCYSSCLHDGIAEVEPQRAPSKLERCPLHALCQGDAGQLKAKSSSNLSAILELQRRVCVLIVCARDKSCVAKSSHMQYSSPHRQRNKLRAKSMEDKRATHFTQHSVRDTAETANETTGSHVHPNICVASPWTDSKTKAERSLHSTLHTCTHTTTMLSYTAARNSANTQPSRGAGKSKNEINGSDH